MGKRSAHDRPEIAHSNRQSGQHVDGRRARSCLGELRNATGVLDRHGFVGRESDPRDTFMQNPGSGCTVGNAPFLHFRTQFQEERCVEPPMSLGPDPLPSTLDVPSTLGLVATPLVLCGLAPGCSWQFCHAPRQHNGAHCGEMQSNVPRQNRLLVGPIRVA